MKGTTFRRFDVDVDYLFESYDDRQNLYVDRENLELIPNTEIWQGGILQMQVNSLGCKGPDIDPALPVIAYVGGGATMGHGFTPDSWPLHVDVPGYPNLNAAIEGTDMQTLATRWERLYERVDVACLVVNVGWHDIVYTRTDEAFWEEQLSRFLGPPVTAFCTLASSLTNEFRARGVEPLLTNRLQSGFTTQSEADSIDRDHYGFFGSCDPAEYLTRLLDGIARYNDFLAGFVDRHDAALIDLHTFLTPRSYEEATADFFDAAHIRPSAYARVGMFVGEQLAPLLAATSELQRDLVAAAESEADPEDPRANLYPIW